MEFLNYLNERPGLWQKLLPYFKNLSRNKADRAIELKLLLDDLHAKGFIQFPSPNEPYADLKDMTVDDYEAKHHNLDALITLNGRIFLKEQKRADNQEIINSRQADINRSISIFTGILMGIATLTLGIEIYKLSTKGKEGKCKQKFEMQPKESPLQLKTDTIAKTPNVGSGL